MPSRELPLFFTPFLALIQLGCASAPIAEPAAVVAEPKIVFSANPALQGDTVHVRVEALPAGEEVVIEASRAGLWVAEQLYRSEVRFVADDQGVIDLSADLPTDGQWDTPDPNGLFWTMSNSGEPTPEGLGPEDVAIRVLDSAQAELATARLTLRWSEKELVETALGDRFPGAFVLRPRGDEPLPAIIVLGGSEGGDRGARTSAPLWAARGYAVVGYPYYSPAWGDQPQAVPGLPRAFANIAVDRLAEVRDALRARGDVQMDRIALYGVSKGAEFVLAAASRIHGFAAVAAIVPSDVIWEGWGVGTTAGQSSSFAWDGEPLAFVPYLEMGRVFAPPSDGKRVAMRVPHAEGRLAHPDAVAPARIRVEDIDEPVFLLGGGQDQVWDSGVMAANIAKTRADAGRVTETLVFANAGHGLSGPPQNPTRPENARAKAAAWPALNEFFARYLRQATR
ncbi:MAG: acyl-CoA thioester hydrolase/BAAT C-terminal domain-containing protein [Pseudomonadota bacterium]